MIERYSSFPSNSDLDFYDRARFIRDHEDDDSEARHIKSKIAQLAEQNKVNYIHYLSDQEINTYRVRGFLFCLLNGLHTIGEINDFFDSVDETKFKNMAPNLTTLYVNKTGSGCEVTEEEIGYRRIDERFDGITLDFPDRESGHTFVSLVVKNAKGESTSILRLVFHWENVFQGIKTPCLNVFLEYDPD